MTDDPTARVPPSDVEAERAVLGAMLLEGEACSVALDIVVPLDFYRAPHRTICETIAGIYDKGQQPDELVLREALESAQKLDEVGGADYLHELANSVPSAANVERYAEIVKERAVARNLINGLTASLREAEGGGLIGDALNHAQARIMEIVREKETSGPVTLTDILEDECKAMEARSTKWRGGDRSIPGVPTGLYRLDDLTGGLRPGQLIFIGARPSVGKTSLIMSMMANLCTMKEAPATLVFSTEMSRAQVGLRILAAHAGVSYRALDLGWATEEILVKARASYVQIDRTPLYIDDTAGLTLAHIRSASRVYVTDHSVRMIVVDFIQDMDLPEGESREREIAKLALGLKWLARELNVAVVALSQLRRPGQGRENVVPRKEALRESGMLEAHADVVIILHRDQDGDGLYVNDAKLILAKQRNGPTAKIDLLFDPKAMRFTETVQA